MKNVLLLNSSAAREASISRLLVEETAATLLAAHPNAAVVRRDLDAKPLPSLNASNLAGIRAVPVSETDYTARKVSDELIAELRAADTVVIGAPMYNFSIPTTLRTWFDYVLRAGETFSYSEAGPKGLLIGKRVIVIEARGGSYSEGPAKLTDFQEPYLRHLLNFIGMTDVTFICAEKTGFGPEARDAAVESAKHHIAALVPQSIAAAA